jgi:hypothetical protein
MSEENDNGSGSGPAELFDESLKSVEAELFPTADVGAEPECERTSDRDGEGPAPFASGDAPWVGAEDKWLRGIDDGSAAAGERPLPGGRRVDEEVLLVAEQLPQLPSLVPQPPSGRGVAFEIGIAVALLLVVAAAAGIVYWMNESFAEREREILALRDSDQQEVARLEREIRELVAKGGAGNEARANELRIELQARQEATGQVVASLAAGDGPGRDGERERRPGRDTEGAKETGAGNDPVAPVPLADYPDDESAPPGAGAAGPGAVSPDEDELLGGAFTGPSAADPAPIQGAAEFPLGAAELPAKPSREQVQAAMTAVAPHVARCGPGSGRMVISVTVAGATGRVVSADSTGEAAGTTLGLCAAKAAKLAKFPRFGQERLQIKYPFEL